MKRKTKKPIVKKSDTGTTYTYKGLPERYVAPAFPEIVKDPRLGRRFERDPRSAKYPIMALLQRIAYQKPKSRSWPCEVVLDQGSEGSCVGHGFAHELIAKPYTIKGVDHKSAVKIYKRAQQLDEYPGSNYEGTSVLAGIKAIQEMYKGTIESYRWVSDLPDMVATLGYHGPIVLGVNWYQGAYAPDSNGFIHVTGNIVGGHCLLARAVDIKKGAIMLRNSWGPGWGMGGDCWISFDDMSRLLQENGEGLVPIHRGWWKK